MASIKYYPLSRVRTGLNTSGNQYRLNGQPYRGPYYLTYKGEAYTGKNPAVGPNELLQPINLVSQVGVGNIQNRRSRLAVETLPTTRAAINTIAFQPELKQLVPYYPVVLESEYTQGHFTRYFAKKVNTNSYILEISYEDYINIAEDNKYEDYEATDLFWQLTGPLTDKRVSQYQIIGGVATTNERIVTTKAKSFNGLVEFIGGNYTKFARITE